MKEKGDRISYRNDYEAQQTEEQKRGEEGADAVVKWRDSGT